MEIIHLFRVRPGPFHRLNDGPDLIARDNDPYIVVFIPVATSADHHIAVGISVDRNSILLPNCDRVSSRSS